MNNSAWTRRLPWSIVAIALTLICLGWLGIARADQHFDHGGRFLRQQMVWSVLAVTVMLALTVPNYRVLQRLSYLAFFVSIVLLVAVYFFPAINGAHRWIRIGGFSLQPSEFAKVALVLAAARFLMYRGNYRRLRGLLLPLSLGLLPTLLVLREPDLGTAMVFLPVLFLILFAAGARKSDLIKVAACGLVALVPMWTQLSREQKSRVTALLEQTGPGQRPDDDGYHLHQSKQMLALGGAWGSRLSGDTIEDVGVYHLPEAHTDFVFSVLGERFGWLGTGGVLLLAVILIWRGLSIAQRTREPFGRLAAVGIVSLFGIQIIVNTAMTVGLLPVTGMSLPLVSYGGSGLVAHAAALGLLLNIGLRPGYELGGNPRRSQANAVGRAPTLQQRIPAAWKHLH